MQFRSVFAWLPLLLCTSSCLSLNWERHLLEKPIPEGSIESLVVGESNLGDCLDSLGAPLFVDELGDRVALTYGWGRNTAWNLSADISFIHESAGSVAYGTVRARMPGVILILDEERILRTVRRGKLSDLRREFERQRPQLVDISDG